MLLCTKAMDLANAAGVPLPVTQWLEANAFTSHGQIALMASSEGEVRAEIIEPMAQGDLVIQAATALIGKVQIKKFWKACRELVDNNARPSTPEAINTEAFIPERDEASIAAAWRTMHNMLLPDSYLLIDTTQGRMWRDFNCDPHVSECG